MILTETTSLVYRGIRPLQRLGAQAKDIAMNNPLAGLALAQKIPDRLLVVPPDPWAGDVRQGRDMISGVFNFSGYTVEKEQLSWQPEGVGAEWLAELHGFEWLRDLRSVGGEKARRMAREMVGSWLEMHPKINGPAWNPDVTGVRLSNWISFHDFFCASADDAFRKLWFTSLVRQAKYLSRILPGGVSGIALIRALKGLAYSGVALEDGEDRLEQAFQMILQQIREQILPDGGHVSRSPQATFAFFQCLVDLRTAMTAARLEVPEELQHALDRIAPAIKFFRHADGAFCQFNGGLEGNSNICDATLMHSGTRGKAMKSLPHTGYERIQQGRSLLLMDVGLPLVSRYSDRAHAGLLGFEYSFGKDRIFVNCGTAGGRWRSLLRSTAAHSTLVADNRNSCQFDDHGLLSSRPEVRCSKQEDAAIALIEAGHNGYVPRFGLTHRRTVRLQNGGETLSGEDILTGKSGVSYAVRFHLHPGIQASLTQDGSAVLLRARNGMGWRFKAEGAVLALEDSIYANGDDIPRHTQQIVMNGMTAGPTTTVAWELTREKKQ